MVESSRNSWTGILGQELSLSVLRDVPTGGTPVTTVSFALSSVVAAVPAASFSSWKPRAQALVRKCFTLDARVMFPNNVSHENSYNPADP